MLVYILATVVIIFSSSNPTEGLVYNQGNVTANKTVLLGALIPIHTSFNTSEPCQQIQENPIQLAEAIVLAINTINEDRNLLPNVNLSFDIRDTCTSVNYALQQSVDYIQSNVNPGCSSSSSSQQELSISSVLGAARSSVSEAVANILGLFQIPQISYGSTAAFLSDKRRFGYFFRTIPPDTFQARALSDIVVHFNWTYIIALHSDDLYGREGIAAFQKELERSNTTRHCIALQSIPLQNDPPNYEEAVNVMNQVWVNNASVVLLFGHLYNAVGMLGVFEARIHDSNFRLRNITWIGSDSWAVGLPNYLRPMARGMISITPRSNSEVLKFDKHFTSLNPRNNPNNPWFAEYWERIFGCSLSPDPEECDLDNQVISPNTTNYRQYSQVPLVINAVYAIAHAIQDMIHALCPSEDLCSEILTGGAISGELLHQYLLNVSFNNTQEIVQFDENGDVSGAYTVLNLQRSGNQYSFEVIGDWDVKNHLSITERIEWVGGNEVPQSLCSMPCKNGEFLTQVSGQAECCFTCESCPDDSIVNNTVRCTKCNLGFRPNSEKSECVEIPVTYFMSSSPWAIVILTVTCIGIVATIFVIVIFTIFFKHAIIKASSRELSIILLAGLLLCFIVPFLYVIKPSAAICGIRRFFIGFCFAVSYSALLVKTNRIHRIFNRKSQSITKKPRFIDPLSQVIITFIFISIQVLIAVVWLAIEHPIVMLRRTQDSNELVCGVNPIIGFIASFVYNFFLLVFSTYFAFRTRKVPENFNEAKFINVTLYTICIIWVVFLAVYFGTIELGTVFQTASFSMAVILSAATTLCCLFISKVVILFTHIQEKKEETKSKNQSNDSAIRIGPISDKQLEN